MIWYATTFGRQECVGLSVIWNCFCQIVTDKRVTYEYMTDEYGIDAGLRCQDNNKNIASVKLIIVWAEVPDVNRSIKLSVQIWF